MNRKVNNSCYKLCCVLKSVMCWWHNSEGEQMHELLFTRDTRYIHLKALLSEVCTTAVYKHCSKDGGWSSDCHRRASDDVSIRAAPYCSDFTSTSMLTQMRHFSKMGSQWSDSINKLLYFTGLRDDLSYHRASHVRDKITYITWWKM